MSPNRIAAQDRVAPASDHVLTGPVTLMNSFTVSPDRDEAFRELWTKTARCDAPRMTRSRASVMQDARAGGCDTIALSQPPGLRAQVPWRA